jgi:hypothetical protein
VNSKFTFTYRWTDATGKEVTNTLETNDNSLDDICLRFTEFLRGCGFYLDRVEAFTEEENYESKN